MANLNRLKVMLIEQSISELLDVDSRDLIVSTKTSNNQN